MDLDPEGIFADDSESDDELKLERDATKELVVYLVDSSPKMFSPLGAEEDEKGETPFHVAVSCISQSLKSQIIGNSIDEVSICFFNTKEKKNLQDSNGVFVFNVEDRESLDRPTARLIKEFSSIKVIDEFLRKIGSRYWMVPGSHENTLYNALWVAQALLRKGSAKTVSKRVLIFTNDDDPFGRITGVIKTDMARTTQQRAKDTQELGISIELLPLIRADAEFNVSILYADLIGLEGDEVGQLVPSASERLEDMTYQLRKRIFKKRKIKTIMFVLSKDVCISLNTYALIRPTLPGTVTWLDSVTNRALKVERSFICADTGALVQEPQERFFPYKNGAVTFSVDEVSAVKRISDGQLHLLGFKPLHCLKDYHNLRPSTFIFPTEEEVIGSTRVFIALYRSMVRFQRFALAFYGSSSHSQLVALIAQDEIRTSGGQVEPPGMNMVYLPYSDDIKDHEEVLVDEDDVPRPTDEHINKASLLLKRIDLRNFSVCQFANPALQRHYAILQALALGEDEIPELKDETLPDAEGMAREGVVKAVKNFRESIYGDDHDDEKTTSILSSNEAYRKRKAAHETGAQEVASYDWSDLADNGKLKDLTMPQLKAYLASKDLPVSGKKETLITRILNYLGK